MPLRRSSTTSGSSATLFHIGQSGQGFVLSGVPPEMAGRDAAEITAGAAPDIATVGAPGDAALSAPGPSVAPTAASPVVRIKSLRPKFLFFMSFSLKVDLFRIFFGLRQYFL